MKLKQNEIMDKCVDHDHDRWKLLLFFKQKKNKCFVVKNYENHLRLFSMITRRQKLFQMLNSLIRD